MSSQIRQLTVHKTSICSQKWKQAKTVELMSKGDKIVACIERW